MFFLKDQYEAKANADMQTADERAFLNLSAWLASKAVKDKNDKEALAKAETFASEWLKSEIGTFILKTKQKEYAMSWSLSFGADKNGYDKLLESAHPRGKFLKLISETFTEFYPERSSYEQMVVHSKVQKLREQLPSIRATLYVMHAPKDAQAVDKELMLDSLQTVSAELDASAKTKNSVDEDTVFKLFAAQHQVTMLQPEKESKRSSSPTALATAQILRSLANVNERVERETLATLVRQPLQAVEQPTNAKDIAETKDQPQIQARTKDTLASMLRTTMQTSTPQSEDEKLAWVIQAKELQAYNEAHQQEASDREIARVMQEDTQAQSTSRSPSNR